MFEMMYSSLIHIATLGLDDTHECVLRIRDEEREIGKTHVSVLCFVDKKNWVFKSHLRACWREYVNTRLLLAFGRYAWWCDFVDPPQSGLTLH